MFNLVKDLGRKILNFIYPSFCIQCNNFIKTENLFCLKCQDKIKSPCSLTIKIGSNTILEIHSLFFYKDPYEKIILSKFSQNPFMFKLSGNMLSEKIEKILKKEKIVGIPIPIHWIRLMKRGYNQAEILSKQIEQKLENYENFNCLKRTKNTKFQSLLKDKDKIENVKNAFEMNSNFDLENLENKKIVLIDDLFTTGATLIWAAKTINNKLKTKPKKIYAFLICKSG